MGSVVNAIRSLEFEVQHIPGGCTGLCQPVDDVGYNKPFKSRLRKEWLRWMISDGILHGTTSPPSHAEVARWASSAANSLKGTEIIKNAWRKSGCS